MVSQERVEDPQIVEVDLDEIEFDPLNPNEMSDEQLYDLQDDIRKHGFDEPITLCPHPQREGKYRCVSGEHRVRAMRTLQRTKIPAVIRNWDEKEASTYMVRRNLLRGDTNKAKLKALIDERLRGISLADLAKQMAFKKESDLASLVASQGRGRMTVGEAFDDVADLQAAANKEMSALKGLGDMVSKIFGEAKGTVENDYLAFELEGHAHYLTIANERLFMQLSLLADHCRDNGVSMCEKLGEILEAYQEQ